MCIALFRAVQVKDHLDLWVPAGEIKFVVNTIWLVYDECHHGIWWDGILENFDLN